MDAHAQVTGTARGTQGRTEQRPYLTGFAHTQAKLTLFKGSAFR
jgi:hypothetical protein